MLNIKRAASSALLSAACLISALVVAEPAVAQQIPQIGPAVSSRSAPACT